MLKHIKTLSKDNFIIFAIAVTLGILYLSLIKMPKTQLDFSNIDKVYHTTAYFVLTLSWLITFYKNPNRKYIIVILCIILGIVVEVLQYALTLYRTADYLDVLANTTGVMLALACFSYFFKKKCVN